MRTFKIWVVVCLCAGVTFAAVPAGFAQTPTQEGYDESGVIGQFQEGGSGPPPSADQPVNGAGVGGSGEGNTDNGERSETSRNGGDDSLPFTGLGLGVIALLGAALVGTGLVLRRTGRPAQG
jgi:hypothetical protein